MRSEKENRSPQTRFRVTRMITTYVTRSEDALKEGRALDSSPRNTIPINGLLLSNVYSIETTIKRFISGVLFPVVVDIARVFRVRFPTVFYHTRSHCSKYAILIGITAGRTYDTIALHYDFRRLISTRGRRRFRVKKKTNKLRVIT